MVRWYLFKLSLFIGLRITCPWRKIHYTLMQYSLTFNKRNLSGVNIRVLLPTHTDNTEAVLQLSNKTRTLCCFIQCAKHWDPLHWLQIRGRRNIKKQTFNVY